MTTQPQGESIRHYVYAVDELVSRVEAPEGFRFSTPSLSSLEEIESFRSEAWKGIPEYQTDRYSDFVQKVITSKDFLPDRSWLLRDQTNDLIGTVLVSKRALSVFFWCPPYISFIAVSPKHRRKGLGTLLLAKAFSSKSTERVDHWMHAHIRPSNTASLRMFEKFGFEWMQGVDD